MSTIQAAKKLLRQEMKRRITSLSKEYILSESNKLIMKLLTHPSYIRSQRIAVYLSMDDEVQTRGILENIFEMGKTCFIPRYYTQDNNMDMVRLHSLKDVDTLPMTKWNVRQPLITDCLENAMESGGLDLVVVPGLAFTTQGHRMGRGKGYYDRFLKHCREVQEVAPSTVALVLKEQLLPHLPTHEYDVLVDTVLLPD